MDESSTNNSHQVGPQRFRPSVELRSPQPEHITNITHPHCRQWWKCCPLLHMHSWHLCKNSHSWNEGLLWKHSKLESWNPSFLQIQSKDFQKECSSLAPIYLISRHWEINILIWSSFLLCFQRRISVYICKTCTEVPGMQAEQWCTFPASAIISVSFIWCD
jgi:hypothetical protein